MTAYATVADVLTRYPSEATVLAANETTRERDDARIAAALGDATVEIQAILFARYTPAQLDNLAAPSASVLAIYCIDIALYRLALSFNRSNERIKERYEAAIARLQAIAAGKGALVIEGENGGLGGGATGEPAGGPNQAVVEAPERVFTRDRLRGL